MPLLYMTLHPTALSNGTATDATNSEINTGYVGGGQWDVIALVWLRRNIKGTTTMHFAALQPAPLPAPPLKNKGKD